MVGIRCQRCGHRGKRWPIWNSQRLSIRRHESDTPLAGCRHRPLAFRADSFDSLRLGATDARRRQFPVKLTMQQVEDTPDVDTARPVTRQEESHVYSHPPGTPIGLAVTCWARWPHAVFAAPPFPVRREARRSPVAYLQRTRLSGHRTKPAAQCEECTADFAGRRSRLDAGIIHINEDPMIASSAARVLYLGSIRKT